VVSLPFSVTACSRLCLDAGGFVNNRHDDTGWAAKVVAEALRRRLGTSSDVFIDNQAIGPGQPFAQVLEDGVRRSEVLVALIGQRWTEPPFMDRLFMADDWVRREILLAMNQQATIVTRTFRAGCTA
jgi:hypothetical protein